MNMISCFFFPCNKVTVLLVIKLHIKIMNKSSNGER